MNRILVVLTAMLVLSVPAALAAPPADKPGAAAPPGQSAEKAAARAAKKAKRELCKALRTTDPAAYRAQCKKAKNETSAQEEHEENAARKCKAERESMGVEDFKEKYAPTGHPNGANALGKCVSALAKESATD